MKQVLQDIKHGQTTVADIPVPLPSKGEVLIASSRTLLSSGTEKMLLDFGKSGWIQKARSQPDKVKMVLDKVKTDGVISTYDSVQKKLNEPLALGYCQVGRVVALGQGVTEFSVGDRVVSNGKHAEYVAVAKNLCAKVPSDVSDDEAVFTVMGAVALQGIRLVQPTLGECVVVSGLGLVGLLAAQLLKANGCRVLGFDLSPEKVELARSLGIDAADLSDGKDPVSLALEFSRGRGVDAVLIAANTSSDELMHQSAQMSRKRGRIVLVGVTGLSLSRADFYEKELSFQVSCSYGPGRYDVDYENKGNDYPFAYVRWTQQRNFEAFLDVLSQKSIDTNTLISHRYAISEAESAYALLERGEGMAILLEYPQDVSLEAEAHRIVYSNDDRSTQFEVGGAKIGFIGSGNYAAGTLIPAFAKTSAELSMVLSQKGVSASQICKKHQIPMAVTDESVLWVDDSINTVVITTRHDSHAEYVKKALEQGKHIFVEKPLCLTMQELNDIQELYSSLPRQPHVMVGFNRRFAPLVEKAQQLLLRESSARHITMLVNAGAIPFDHWIQDPAVGGGRIIGEVCHFIDLARYFAGASIAQIQVQSGQSRASISDNVVITLGFSNGSTASINYFSSGNKAYPKERIDIFCGGKVLCLDNYRTLKGYGFNDFKRSFSLRQDKGQIHCVSRFVQAIHNAQAPLIAFDEVFEVMKTSLLASELAEQQAE